jgi:hypothetical protein
MPPGQEIDRPSGAGAHHRSEKRRVGVADLTRLGVVVFVTAAADNDYDGEDVDVVIVIVVVAAAAADADDDGVDFELATALS